MNVGMPQHKKTVAKPGKIKKTGEITKLAQEIQASKKTEERNVKRREKWQIMNADKKRELLQKKTREEIE